MTEPFNPFGADGEAPGLVEETETGGDSKRNLIALGGLGAVVLAAGAYFLVSSGGDDALEDTAFVPPQPRAAAPAASAAPQAVKLPVATQVALGRNPFKALYVAPAAAAAPAGGGGTTTPVVTPTTVAPVTGGGTPIVVTPPTTGGTTAPVPPQQPTTGGTTAPTAAPTRAPAQQSTLSFTSVSRKSGEPVGSFVYDGTMVSGGVGDVMAGKLKVISLQQDATGKWFANLQLGDGSPFEVFEGQKVVVS